LAWLLIPNPEVIEHGRPRAALVCRSNRVIEIYDRNISTHDGVLIEPLGPGRRRE
jgi:hypothetical protein